MLTAASLKTKILEKLTAISGDSFAGNMLVDPIAQAIAEAVVEELTTNAVVAPGSMNVAAAPVEGSGSLT